MIVLRTFSTIVFCVCRYCVCCCRSSSRARALSACAERLRNGMAKVTPAAYVGKLLLIMFERALPKPAEVTVVGKIGTPRNALGVIGTPFASTMGSLGIGTIEVGVLEV